MGCGKIHRFATRSAEWTNFSTAIIKANPGPVIFTVSRNGACDIECVAFRCYKVEIDFVVSTMVTIWTAVIINFKGTSYLKGTV